TVNQSTNRAVIDWRGFDIAPHETTRFVQPNAGSWTLNRVNAANPSLIQGNIQANGNIAIINPNGVIFSGTSRVDAAGLVASTANISNANFMAGNMKFDQAGKADAKVINEGVITAKQAGLVGLVAPQVENSGVIEAKLGKVALAAGETFTLDMAGDKLIEVAISDGVAARLKHTGSIAAEGGKVLLTAAAGRTVVDSLIQVSGDVTANTVAQKNGEIIISATGANKTGKAGDGRVEVSGRLRAAGDEAGEKGGSIRVLGDTVAVTGHALINASGRKEGGRILIGGDYQGTGDTQTSRVTYIDGDVTLKASAISQGWGGRVIVWSDGDTGFYGDIEAKGGATGGNGGFVEVSGKRWLDFAGMADVRAFDGAIGTLLLDPTNITISNGANAAAWDGTQFTGAGMNTILNTTTLQNQLALSNVIVTTVSGGGGVGDINVDNGFTWSSHTLQLIADHDIILNTNITYSGAGNSSLSLKARNDITINSGSDITAAGAGKLDITLNSDSDNTGAGAIGASAAGTQLVSNSGNIILGGGLDPTTDEAMGSAAGGHDGIDMSGATINAGGGSIIMRGRTAEVGYAGIYLSGATIQTSGTGTITLFGAGAASGTDVGGILLDGTSVTSVNGNITMTGSAGGNGNDGAGIWLDNASLVETTGALGNIIMSGTFAGAGSMNYGSGVALNHGSIVRVTDGDISITGSSGGAADIYYYGVALTDSSFIRSLGTGGSAGTITVDGTVTNTGGGSYDWGIWASSGNGGDTSAITSVDGAISVTGSVTGTGTDQHGVGFESGSGGGITSTGSASITITGTGNGDASSYGIFGANNSATVGGASATGAITLIADTMNLDNSTIRTSGDVAIRPKTAGATVGVGVTTESLDITSTMLGRITYGGTLWLGGSSTWNDSGNTTVNITRAFNGNVNFMSGADLLVTGGVLSATNAGAKTWNFRADNNIIFSGSADITSSTGSINLTLNSDRDNDNLGAIKLGSGMNIASNGGLINLGGGANPLVDEAVGNGANYVGVLLEGAGLDAGGGNITILGRGSASGGGFSNVHGVSVDDDGSVASSVTTSSGGTITITGYGGTGGTNNSYYGVLVSGNGAVESSVQSQNGAITITGAGGTTTGSYANGIVMYNKSRVEATGSGGITFNGTGGTSTTGNSAVVFTTSVNRVITNTGNIAINGTGTSSNGNSNGIRFETSGTVESTGGGTVTLDGQAAGTNNGLYIDATRLGSNVGTGTSLLTLIADGITYTAGVLQSAADVVIRPRSSTTTVGIGDGATASTTLDIGDTFLNNIAWGGVLWLGGSSTWNNSGNTTINTTRNLNGNVNFMSGASIMTTGGVLSVNTAGTKAWNFYANHSILYSGSADITATTGKINLLMNSDYDGSLAGAISLGSGTSITTNGGDITLSGGTNYLTGYAYGTASNADGIFLNSATLTAGNGNVVLRGHGQNNGSVTSRGVVMSGGVSATGGGTISITGVGAKATSGNNIGLAGINSQATISAVDGLISFNGTGGQVAGATNVTTIGIVNLGGSITSSGTGGITLIGNAGSITSGSASWSTGMDFQAGTVSVANGNMLVQGQGTTNNAAWSYGVGIYGATFQSTGTGASAGNITITGTSGAGTESESPGVLIGYGVGSPGIITTVDGDVSITGTRPGATARTDAHGIWFYANDGSKVESTGDGNITLTGTTASSGSQDIYMNLGNIVGKSTSTGDITLNANTLETNGATIVTSHDIYVKNRTAGTAIGIGSGSGALSISNIELGGMDGRMIAIGQANAGAMDINSAFAFDDPMVFYSNTGITVNAGLSTVAASDGAFDFEGPTTFNYTADTSNSTSGSGIVLGNFSHVLGADLRSATRNITINGAVTLSGAGTRIIGTSSSGTVNIGATGSITSAGTSLRFTGSDFSIAGAVTGGGGASLAFGTLWAGSLGIADGATCGGACGANISTAELDLISGWGNVYFGGGGTSYSSVVDIRAYANWAGRATGSINFSGAAISVNGAQAYGARNIGINADTIDIASTLTGTGNLTFVNTGLTAASTANVDYGIGDGSSGEMNFTNAELNNIVDGWNSIIFGNSTAGAMDIRAYGWRDNVQFNINSSGSITVNGAQTTAAGGYSSTITFNGPTTFNADVNTSNSGAAAGAITLGNFVHTLGADLTTDDSNITINGAVTLNGVALGTRVINAGTGNFTIAATGSINSNPNLLNLNLIADNMDIQGPVYGSSIRALTVAPSSVNRVMNLAGGAGGLDLSAAELDFLSPAAPNRWNSISYGINGQGGGINLYGHTWSNVATLYAFNNLGNINIIGTQDFTGVPVVTFTSGGDLSIGAALTGNGTLNLGPINGGQTWSVATGTGTFDLSVADLDNITDGWSGINIGRFSTTNPVSIGAYSNWRDPITFTTATGVMTVTGAQATGVGSNGSFTFNGPTTFNANVDTRNSAAGVGTIVLGNYNHTLGADLITDDSGITINGPVALSGGAVVRTINAGTGTLTTTATGTISSTGQSLTLIADNMTLGAALSPTGGSLTIAPGTASRGVNFGTPTGGLDLSVAELDLIDNGWSIITIGNYPTYTGLTTLGGFSLNDSLQVYNGGASNIVVSDTVNMLGNNLGLVVGSGDVILNSTIASAGGSLTIRSHGSSYSIALGGGAGNVALSTAELDNIVDGWNAITFGNGAGQPITLAAYSNWRDPVTFNSGGGLGSITVSGAQSTLAGSNARFTFSGPTTFNANVDTSNSSAGAGTITLGNFAHTLGADLITDDSDVTINGSVTLSSAAIRYIQAGTATLNTAGTSSFNIIAGSALRFVADNMTLAGAITGAGTGEVGFGTYTASRTIGIGTGATCGGTCGLMLDDSEIALLSGSYSQIHFGTTAGTGLMDIRNVSLNLASTLMFDSAATRIVDINGTINTGTKSLAIMAGDININAGAALQGTGTLTFDQRDDSRNINVGTAASLSGMKIDDTELGRITNGWSNIRFGNRGYAGTGQIEINTAYQFNDSATFTGNSATVNNSLTTAVGSNAGFTFDAATTFNANVDTSNSSAGAGTITLGNFSHTLGADLITDDSNITINGPVTLSGGVGVTRTINAGTGTFTNSATGTISASSANLSLIADGFSIGGDLNGPGQLSIRNKTLGKSLGLADGATGDIVLTSAMLDHFNGKGWASFINLGSISWTGAVDMRSYIWNAGTGTLYIQGGASNTAIGVNGAVNFGSNNAILRAYDLNINTATGSLAGTGALSLWPIFIGNQMGIGTAASSTDWKITDAELARLVDGFSSLQFGMSNGVGNFGNHDINTAYQFQDLTIFTNDTGINTVNSALSTRAGTNGSFIFNGPTTFNAAVNTSNSSAAAGAITLGNFAHTLGAGLTADDSNITINGAVTLSGNQTINAGSGTIIVGATGSIAAGANDLALQSDDINLGGDISGTGNLELKVSTTGRSMAIGDGATGLYALSNAELDHIQNGFSWIFLGRAAAGGGIDGNIDLQSYVWRDNVIIRRIDANAVTVSGAMDMQNNYLQISADSLDINTATGSLLGTGTLSLASGTSGHVGIGTAADNLGMHLTDAELARISDGHTFIRFTDGTSYFTNFTIDVNTAFGFTDSVVFSTFGGRAITVNGSLTTGAGSNGNFNFNGPTSFNANVDTSNSSVGAGTIVLGNFAHTLGADLIADDSNITINGATALSGAAGTTRTINAGAGTLTTAATGTLSATSQNMQLIADSVALGASVTSTTGGGIILRPYTAGRAVNIGTAAGVTNFSLDDTELNLIGWTGGGTLWLGGSAGWNDSGATTINTTRNLNGNVNFMSGADILVTGGNLQTSSAGAKNWQFIADDDIVFSGSADITASGGALNITLRNDEDNDAASTTSFASGTSIATNGGSFTNIAKNSVLSSGASVASGAGNQEWDVNTLDLSGTISTTAQTTITPRSSTRSIGIGAGAGTLSLDDIELGHITTGSLVIGGVNANSITIDTAYAFDGPTSFVSNTGITVSSALGTAVGSDGSFSFQGPTTF
ncbi:filamentous hemagglutinin N-terminal domain-containing protein, partial [bacterium]|nr:filamentous hemagglutinin N-terminal domain-containing protein [bacterium]